MNSTNTANNCVVLYSGGMDSTVVLHHAVENYDTVYVLSFDYQQKNIKELTLAEDYITQVLIQEKNKKNIRYARMPLPLHLLQFNSALLRKDIEIPKMRDVIGDPQNMSYVPNRNLIFLSLAVGMAESHSCGDVLYGAAKADDTSGFWDCTQDFRQLLNTILSLNRRNHITIKAPLIDKSKKEIIEYGIQLGVDFSRTRTCYTDRNEACGECPSCSARLAGFIQLKKIDPLEYSRFIDWNKHGCTIL